MNGKRFIQSIRLRNLLSYGSRGTKIEMQPLNVLIGPNASGKSNFIEALRILESLPGDLPRAISRGGGIDSLLWKGGGAADVELEVSVANESDKIIYTHHLTLREIDHRPEVAIERITGQMPDGNEQKFYDYTGDQPFIWVHTQRDDAGEQVEKFIRKRVVKDTFKRDQSILAQRSDPDTYPALTYLSNQYENIWSYADLSLGRGAPARNPQPADLESHFLFQNAENLSLVLSSLLNNPPVKHRLLRELRRFAERVTDIVVHVSYGTAQLYLEEEGMQANIPATRISDGTLHYLCLLSILCHPTPPPVICIEEPEVGLHPDMLRSVAELMAEASQRTQLVVTTHSDLLVSALSHVPDAVIVCERNDDGTHLQRLDPEMLHLWLERYTLGELWLKGEIGGTR